MAVYGLSRFRHRVDRDALRSVCRPFAKPVYDSAFTFRQRRPQFIAVAVSGVRRWERVTLSRWFNFYGNCYSSQFSIRLS
jgi:hypothetical protein